MKAKINEVLGQLRDYISHDDHTERPILTVYVGSDRRCCMKHEEGRLWP